MKQQHEAIKALYRAFELLTEYLVDECPEDCTWEDFAPEVDDARFIIHEVISELEASEQV